jgi:PAS domain S-box-containing protein
MELLRAVFRTDFLPHGHCYFWRPEILWLNVGSDFLIALAYYSIPVALLFFVRRRPAMTFGFLFWMFGAFIFLCGTTHVIEIWTVWSGVYQLQGVVKLLTAGVSLATAAALWPVIPKALSLPMPAELEAKNRELRREIARRETVEAELRSVQGELEDRIHDRTAALGSANQALTREVAERERAEERFRRAVESSPNGVVMIDEAGAIVLVNEAVERIFGYGREELVGAPIETLVPARARDSHRSFRARFLREPRMRQMGAGRDLYGLRKDGSAVPVEIGLNPIRTAEGVFVLSSIVDITQRKRSERLIDEKTRELERSNRELDDFAHVVSHDLKAPLRGISSLTAWIADDCAPLLPRESRDHLAQLSERARRMSELIDGILHYSRIGRARLEPSEVDTQLVAEEVIDSLAPPRGVRIRIAPRLPVVVYDRTQLVQIFQNLVGNAIQHLGKPAGEIVVSCHEEPDHFEFSVRDDGVGIAERHFDRIFKIFQTLERPPDGDSTGIGLAIVKRIVENHRGSISVESAVGNGTTFRFTVPKLGLQLASPAESRNG